VGAQVVGGDAGVVGQAGVRGELPGLLVAVRDHGRPAHGRVQQEDVFGLARFHPVAADLDLVVQTPQEGEVAVRQQFHPVPGQVRPALRMSGLGDELPGRQLRPAQVAAGHPGPADAQLAVLPRRHRPPVGAEDMGDGAGHRTADGHRRPAPVVLERGVQFEPAGVDRGLGRPVAVDDAAAGQGAQRGAHRLHVGAVTAGDEQAQSAQIVQDMLDGQPEQRCGQPEHGHLVHAYRVPDLVHTGLRLLGQDQGRPVEQGAPDLQHRRVDVQRRQLQHHIVGGQPHSGAAHQMQQRAVLDHHPLGPPGAARGVDDVGQAVGAVAGRPRGHRRGGRRVRLQHSHVRGEDGAQPGRRLRCGEERAGAALLDQRAQPVLRGVGVQRQAGAPGERHAEHRGHRRRRARGADRDQFLGREPVRQPGGDRAGPVGQVTVAQPDAVGDHRGMVGALLGHRGEDVADGG
jgi:hypothetical protein